MRTAAIVVAVVVALLGTNAVYAGCGGCGPKKCATSAQTDSKGGCPIEAAVAKLTLSDAQATTIKAARAEFDAALKKAECISCPKTSGKTKASAASAYIKKISAALTPEQQKAFAASLPTTGCPLTK